jgi:hypothetical protein
MTRLAPSLALLVCATLLPAAEQTIDLVERFGVTHPDQVLSFALAAPLPAGAGVVDASGNPVPFQVSADGKRLLLRCDLPAGAARRWTIVLGTPAAPAAADTVVVAELPDGGLELRNGRAGVRLPKPDRARASAPLAGLHLGGRWLGEVQPLGLGVADSAVKDMQVALVERGPLRAVAEVSYVISQPTFAGDTPRIITLDGAKGLVRFHPEDKAAIFDAVPGRPLRVEAYNAGTPPTGLTHGEVLYARPAGAQVGDNAWILSRSPDGEPVTFSGEGASWRLQTIVPGQDRSYVCRISLDAGQPTVMLNEDSSAAVRWELPLTGFGVDQVRYRGHYATSVELGRTVDGKAYRPRHERTDGQDAFYDIPVAATIVPDFQQAGWTPHYLAQWDQWAFNQGWCSAWYAKGAADSAPLLGMFHGRAAQVVALGGSTAGLATRPAGDGTATPALSVRLHHRSNSAALVDRVAFGWGIVAGTKADLGDPLKPNHLTAQMNLHSGIGLDQVKELTGGTFPDAASGYGAMFMPRDKVAALIAPLRVEGEAGRAAFERLAKKDSMNRQMFAMLGDTSGAQTRALVANAQAAARQFLDNLVNRNGIYEFAIHYWHGGLEASRLLQSIDIALGFADLTADERIALKQVMELYALVLWNDDFVPMHGPQGVNLGTPNMPVQQAAMRYQMAVTFPEHPLLKPHVPEAVAWTRSSIRDQIRPEGAHFSCVHYIDAAMGPTLILMQQLQQRGIADLFADEPRMHGFARFLLDVQTPAEPRFANQRRTIALGDTSTEPSELPGILATGFAASDPALSRQLMGAWRAQGGKHGGFHGSTVFKIDETLPSEAPTLTGADYPGYLGVLRTQAGSPSESAAWLINGTHYFDHAHNDLGSVIAYLLGAPVSLDFGSLYKPRADGATIHATAVPLSRIEGGQWSADGLSIHAGQWTVHYGVSVPERSHQPAADGGSMGATLATPSGEGIRANRQVRLKTEDDLAVLRVTDRFTGLKAGGVLLTWPLMAQGAIRTPAGDITPARRVWAWDSQREEQPSASAPFALAAGFNRFDCVGQVWPAHPAGGVDFTVFVDAGASAQGVVGAWGWSDGQTAVDPFREANGREFSEEQHLLRVHNADGAFDTVIVAWPKGKTPADLAIRRDGDAVVVHANGSERRIE